MFVWSIKIFYNLDKIVKGYNYMWYKNIFVYVYVMKYLYMGESLRYLVESISL